MAEHVDFMRDTEEQTQVAIMVAELDLIAGMLKLHELGGNYQEMMPYLNRMEQHTQRLRTYLLEANLSSVS